MSYADIDEKIQIGYTKIYDQKDCVGGCDVWLYAWEAIKAAMDAEGLSDISEAEKLYQWQQFIYNFVQDLEMELMNAGLVDRRYIHKHIDFCQELISRSAHDQFVQNMRMDMGISIFRLGDSGESDRLFEGWLRDDPDWGYGYVGWMECYSGMWGTPDYERAEAIIAEGLLRPGLRDRKDVLEHAIALSENRGDTAKARSYRQELRRMASVHVEKVRRNEPCPCGSGKKYKKCCGA